MWCIHNKKPICWTYWIFNQLLSYAPRKDSPLTHGHVITIVAKALNIDLADYTRKVECSYFTNHAFVRGEVVDAGFFLFSSGLVHVGVDLLDHPELRSLHPLTKLKVNLRKNFLNINPLEMFLY